MENQITFIYSFIIAWIKTFLWGFDKVKSSVACNFVISFWGRFVIREGFPKKEEKGKNFSWVGGFGKYTQKKLKILLGGGMKNQVGRNNIIMTC